MGTLKDSLKDSLKKEEVRKFRTTAEDGKYCPRCKEDASADWNGKDDYFHCHGCHFRLELAELLTEAEVREGITMTHEATIINKKGGERNV